MDTGQDLKRCFRCGLEKPLESFCVNRKLLGPVGRGRHTYCKACVRAYRDSKKEFFLEYGRRYHRDRKVEERAKRKRLWAEQKDALRAKYFSYTSTPSGAASRLMVDARTRAKKKGVPFSVSTKDIKALFDSQRGRCALTGVELSLKKGMGNGLPLPSAVSLDRVVPSLGYVDGNVRLICYVVNVMKGDRTDDDLFDWCQRVIDTQRDRSGSTTVADHTVRHLNVRPQRDRRTA